MSFTRTLPAVTRVEPPFLARSMRTLLAMIGAWFLLNAFRVVAAINDKLQSWVSYLFGASVVIGLMISGTILMLP
jgi:hypothetical protein